MHTSRPYGRGRLVAAVLVSLSLHALVGIGWLSAQAHGSAGGRPIKSEVDGPADHETVFVLREPRAERPITKARSTPTPVQSTPGPLPASVTNPPAPAMGAEPPIGVSPATGSHLPDSGNARPLHGKKAGTTVAYVLDHSASMGPDGLLKRAVAALKASLAELGPDVRFQIVAYNGGTSVLATEPLAATPAAVERAGQWLAQLTADGRSNHRAGFREALSAKPDEVFLLTDADDLEESDVRAIAALLHTPVRISAAVFGGIRPAAGTPLERLVSRTGGSVQYVGP